MHIENIEGSLLQFKHIYFSLICETISNKLHVDKTVSRPFPGTTNTGALSCCIMNHGCDSYVGLKPTNPALRGRHLNHSATNCSLYFKQNYMTFSLFELIYMYLSSIVKQALTT